MATGTKRATRTDPETRKAQLIEAAIPAFGERGYDGVELKDVATEVGVTPNLIHHYFPGGKRELYLEAVSQACDEVVAIHDTDPTADIDTKMPANTSAYLSEALVPTPRYLLFTRATRSPQPEIASVATEARDRIISGIALNHLGTPSPPPEVHAALVGLAGFLEASADQWRELGVDDREGLERLLMDVTRAAVGAVATGGSQTTNGSGP